MPRRDGTGPDGKGALTGRKMGNCEGNIRDKSTGYRIGFGRGRRMGRGRRFRGK